MKSQKEESVEKEPNEVELLKIEIEYLKARIKANVEQIAADVHYQDSLLVTNRELGERIAELEAGEKTEQKARR